MKKNIEDEIKRYLPKYLSPETEEALFENLKDFPKKEFNIYSNIKHDFLMQGDGVIYNEQKIMLISNTCDMDKSNKRFIGMNILYAPICSIEKTKKLLKNKNIDSNRIDNFIISIKSNKVTNIFYLPKNEYLEEDSFIMFDKINNIPNNISVDKLLKDRLFILSQTGFYLFLLKLSIHFTRMCEKIDRDK